MFPTSIFNTILITNERERTAVNKSPVVNKSSWCHPSFRPFGVQDTGKTSYITGSDPGEAEHRDTKGYLMYPSEIIFKTYRKQSHLNLSDMINKLQLYV